MAERKSCLYAGGASCRQTRKHTPELSLPPSAHHPLGCRKGENLQEASPGEGAKYRENFFNFYDARLMDGAWQRQPDAARIEMFFRLLAVCHTVIPCGPQVGLPARVFAVGVCKSFVCYLFVCCFSCVRSGCACCMLGRHPLQPPPCYVLFFVRVAAIGCIWCAGCVWVCYFICLFAITCMHQSFLHTQASYFLLRCVYVQRCLHLQ